MIIENTPSVLVVDDDGAHRLMLSSLLEDWGFKVDEAQDGLDAVRIAESRQFQVIFMDALMPRLDGLEATRLIRQFSPETLILMVTACPFEKIKEQAIRAGATAFFTKPLDFGELKRELVQKLGTDGSPKWAGSGKTCSTAPTLVAGEVHTPR